MCRHDDSADMLCLALDARLVLNTLWGFCDGKELHPHSEEGIKKIAEIQQVLQSAKQNAPLYSTGTEYGYEQLKVIDECAVGWESWESDLDQWLINLVPVKRFFAALESKALNRSLHGCMG